MRLEYFQNQIQVNKQIYTLQYVQPTFTFNTIQSIASNRPRNQTFALS